MNKIRKIEARPAGPEDGIREIDSGHVESAIRIGMLAMLVSFIILVLVIIN